MALERLSPQNLFKSITKEFKENYTNRRNGLNKGVLKDLFESTFQKNPSTATSSFDTNAYYFNSLQYQVTKNTSLAMNTIDLLGGISSEAPTGEELARGSAKKVAEDLVIQGLQSSSTRLIHKLFSSPAGQYAEDATGDSNTLKVNGQTIFTLNDDLGTVGQIFKVGVSPLVSLAFKNPNNASPEIYYKDVKDKMKEVYDDNRLKLFKEMGSLIYDLFQSPATVFKPMDKALSDSKLKSRYFAHIKDDDIDGTTGSTQIGIQNIIWNSLKVVKIAVFVIGESWKFSNTKGESLQGRLVVYLVQTTLSLGLEEGNKRFTRFVVNQVVTYTKHQTETPSQRGKREEKLSASVMGLFVDVLYLGVTNPLKDEADEWLGVNSL